MPDPERLSAGLAPAIKGWSGPAREVLVEEHFAGGDRTLRSRPASAEAPRRKGDGSPPRRVGKSGTGHGGSPGRWCVSPSTPDCAGQPLHHVIPPVRRN